MGLVSKKVIGHLITLFINIAKILELARTIKWVETIDAQHAEIPEKMKGVFYKFVKYSM